MKRVALAAADTSPAWCPGCGNFAILKTLNEAIEQTGLDTRRLVLVSGIGQAAKTPHYVDAPVNVFNGLHGRALPAATGIKIANHDLEVIVTSGDGDMYGEGGNHFLHAIRRNISVKAFVHNNQVYGLTKGQASPTSDPGFVTKIQTHGVTAQPLQPLALAIVEDCSFVARCFSGDREHLRKMMVRAIEHREGFADSHDPTDPQKALALAMTWGDEIPIGVLYRGARPSFEAGQPVLARGTLCGRYEQALS